MDPVRSVIVMLNLFQHLQKILKLVQDDRIQGDEKYYANDYSIISHHIIKYWKLNCFRLLTGWISLT